MLAKRASNANQYLQKVGHTWYVRVKVPRTLESYVGQTHLRRSLKTTDLAEANRRKHAVVAEIKAHLEQEKLQQAAGVKPRAGISFGDAVLWRDALIKAQAEGDEIEEDNLSFSAADQAAKVEQLFGHDKAVKWYKAATSTAPTLRELSDQWLASKDYKASTKAGHRKALAEVLDFIKDPDGHLSDINRTTAIQYIETDLTQRSLAHNTLRDRLVSLGALWKWIASRGLISKEANPWTDHSLSKKQNKGTRPPKRAYTDDELVKLLQGTAESKGWPTMAYLPDLIVLGMFTGAREEEICSLMASDIETVKEGYILNVTDAKTQAGNRPVAVTHPAPVAIIKRRLAAAIKPTAKTAQLFPELRPGGYDHKFSFSAVKAFGRYRRACGVPDGTDFHSFRRTVITKLEHAGVGQVPIARFVGHKVGTLAADVYSTGGSKPLSIETSKEIRFAARVDDALRR